MMAKETAKLDMQGLEYVHRDGFLETDTSYALSLPVADKEKMKALFGFPSGHIGLTQLGQALGLNSEEEKKYLHAHEERLKKYNRVSRWFTLIFYFPVAGLIVTLLVSAAIRLIDSADSVLMMALVFVPYFVILIFTITMVLLTAGRITDAILHRSYADSLAVAACLNLIIELSLTDLLLPDGRSIIIKRAVGLRKFLTLLSYRYGITNARSIDLAHQHYKKMEYYMGDIEHQILIPNSTTQSKLKRELFLFMKILLTSRYAEFKYNKKITLVEEKVESNTKRIFNGVLRTIGALIPLVLFIGLLVYPDRFGFLGSYTNVVALVSLAWLLLAIDSLLGVGIIDRASTLAKAIKELR